MAYLSTVLLFQRSRYGWCTYKSSVKCISSPRFVLDISHTGCVIITHHFYRLIMITRGQGELRFSWLNVCIAFLDRYCSYGSYKAPLHYGLDFQKERLRGRQFSLAQLWKSVKSNLLSFYRLLQANFHMEAFPSIPCFKLNLNFCSTLFY